MIGKKNSETALPYDITSATSIFEYSKYAMRRDATDVLHTHGEIRIPCTTRSSANHMNRQIIFSSNHILTNEWNGGCLLNDECTHVHCPGRSLVLGASAPY